MSPQNFQANGNEIPKFDFEVLLPPFLIIPRPRQRTLPSFPRDIILLLFFPFLVAFRCCIRMSGAKVAWYECETLDPWLPFDSSSGGPERTRQSALPRSLYCRHSFTNK